MADGFDIHIDGEQAARLQAVADMLGLSAADYARSLIEAGLEDLPERTIDPDPAIDRAIVAKARETGNTVAWTQVRDRLRARHR
jgi:hypothetical protein